MCKAFPLKVFEDIDPSEFQKHNKKQVSENFVAENFKDAGWEVYFPISDTGIDIVVAKHVCPNGHTQWNQTLGTGSECPMCGAEPVRIFRFIQIKTRELKENVFGFTLRPKDIITDPRYVLLLFSDHTNDFLAIPIYEYMSFFIENKKFGRSHFGSPSFRVGNNKVNNLYWKEECGTTHWYWSSKKYSFDKFLNESGMCAICLPEWDLNLRDYVKRLSEMRIKLFYEFFKKGKQELSEEEEKKILNSLTEIVKENKEQITTVNNIPIYKIAAKRKKVREQLMTELKNSNDTLIQSIKGYLSTFKGVHFDA